MTRIERAHSPGYIVKYTSKGDDAAFPFRARLFGVGASVRGWRRVARWTALPRWLRELSCEGDILSRVVGVGWVNRNTGEVYGSQWRFGFHRDEVGWVVWFERISPFDGAQLGSESGGSCGGSALGVARSRGVVG